MITLSLSKLTLKAIKQNGSMMTFDGDYSYSMTDGTCNGFKGKKVLAKRSIVRIRGGVLTAAYICKDSGTIGAVREFKTLAELKTSL